MLIFGLSLGNLITHIAISNMKEPFMCQSSSPDKYLNSKHFLVILLKALKLELLFAFSTQIAIKFAQEGLSLEDSFIFTS